MIFGEKKLKISYWYVSHKLYLKKILIGFVFIIDMGLILFSLYGLLQFYVFDSANFQRMNEELSRNLIKFQEFHAKHRPQNLEILDIKVIDLGSDKVDLVAHVRNPNNNWAIKKISYQFVLDGRLTPERQTFILPGEEKFLLALGEISQRRQDAKIQFNIDWQRISGHTILDFPSFSKERINFNIEDIEFTPARNLGLDDVNRTTFRFTNQSVYNYWQVGFYVILYRYNSIVGANFVGQNGLRSNESRQVEVHWFGKLPLVTKTVVIPEVNILDPNIFMPLEKVPGEPK